MTWCSGLVGGPQEVTWCSGRDAVELLEHQVVHLSLRVDAPHEVDVTEPHHGCLELAHAVGHSIVDYVHVLRKGHNMLLLHGSMTPKYFRNTYILSSRSQTCTNSFNLVILKVKQYFICLSNIDDFLLLDFFF